MSEAGGSPASFFRVFDLAFFVPGVVLVGVGIQTEAFSAFNLDLELDKLAGIIRGVGLLGLAYLLGLLVHSITDLIGRGWKGIRPWLNKIPLLAWQWKKPTHPPWYAQLDEPRRHDIATYFWYMKAVCANLSVALLGVIAIVTFATIGTGTWVGILLEKSPGNVRAVLGGAVLVFALMARRFDQSFRRIFPPRAG
jgi:uncharacterized Tic20 family protein